MAFVRESRAKHLEKPDNRNVCRLKMADDGAASIAESVASGSTAQKPAPERFILEFISVVDVPCVENRTKSDIYLQAFIGIFTEGEVAGGRMYQAQRFGETVRTPVRYDCSAAVWNCFRNLGPNPPPESVLTIELFHHYKDTHKVDCLLGKVDIPVRALIDGEAITFPLINFKVEPTSVIPSLYSLCVNVSCLLSFNSLGWRGRTPSWQSQCDGAL